MTSPRHRLSVWTFAAIDATRATSELMATSGDVNVSIANQSASKASSAACGTLDIHWHNTAIHTSCEEAPCSVGQLTQASLQKSPFRFLLRETQSLLVRGAGFCGSPQSPAEVGAGCMRQVIVHEFTAGENRIVADDDLLPIPDDHCHASSSPSTPTYWGAAHRTHSVGGGVQGAGSGRWRFISLPSGAFLFSRTVHKSDAPLRSCHPFHCSYFLAVDRRGRAY